MSKADATGSQNQLDGLKILVTRPAGQATTLINAIQEKGGIAHSFPLIEIRPATRSPDNLARISDYDWVIFVSRNAVECAWPLLPVSVLPESVKLAAVGQATASALEQNGCPANLVPSNHFDSEGLLAMPELAELTGKQILIVRGQSGREMLSESLRSRGAHVDYAEVYQRLPTKQALTYEDDDIDVIIITSGEALVHLQQLAIDTGKPWLFNKQLLVLHERIAMRTRELGFTLNPVVADQASEAALLDALQLMNH